MNRSFAGNEKKTKLDGRVQERMEALGEGRLLQIDLGFAPPVPS